MRRPSANGNHIVSLGFLESLNTFLHYFHTWISFNFVKDFISHFIFIKQIGNFFHHLEFYQIGIGHDKSLLKTARFHLCNNPFNSAMSVVAGFIQYKTIGHDFSFQKLKPKLKSV